MNAPIITAENIAKRYLIGQRHNGADGLRHVLESKIRAPLRWLTAPKHKSPESDRDFWALRDINFKINRGEVVGIIGRNGAGKSTLLKLLSRVTEPTKGKIRLQGRVASLLEVGTGFHPELTGRENVSLNGAILGMSRHEIRRKFDEIVAFSEVERFIDTPVKRYSSGMYVRLAFAVAAHLEPEILIVDEVLAVGDADFQKKCVGKMEDVARNRGRTILLVSHQMPVIQNLCDRCLLLDKGRITYDGPTGETIERYSSKAGELTASSLSARTDRQGKGEAVITHVSLHDAEGRPVREILSGQCAAIRVGFAVRPGLTLRNCRISLSIVRDSRPMITLSTDLTEKTPLKLSGAGEIEFAVTEWPLSGGTYHVSTYLASDGEITQDWVDDAALIQVTDGDFYGTGKLYHEGWQGRCVLVRHSWKLRDWNPDPPPGGQFGGDSERRT